MDYKKKYENALPYIKDLVEHNVISIESAGKYFPELKESEDEKILRHLKAVVKEYDMWTERGLSMNDVLAWLEKQGEQKQDPCDNCKDVMLNCHNFPCIKKRAFKQGKTALEVINEDGEKITYSETDGYKLVGTKFKIGDTMRTLQEASNGITSGLPVVVSIDNEYYHCNNELIAIKEQDNYEYPPMNRRQKPSWSEEDENLLKASFENLTELKDMYGEEYGKVGDCISWLKSLKQRYTWKPSDEQLDALQYVYRNLNPPLSDKLGWNSLKTLELMYHDLKKLK